ncbi:MAG: DEAD/DEAH box helicase family protein [Symplocastrum torsivum CPER-KK1]|uniref:DEAD/DEAH box helicase family protein n=1 Tax=Symplocastrum torsivum CPER-KK1 TaxID=450513 RepID=A0A951PSV2_9CYAN|nr:DEAD/DEAH box helicase family protein [Symplocastrum torsivum CPER-KK1]
MGLSEQDTRSKLIDPTLYQRGWTEELIKREENAGTIEIIDGEAHKQNRGRVDYTLRLQVSPDSQPVAVALIEAKKEDLPANHGLEQVKRYAKGLNVPFLFSSNGHLFVEYDCITGITSHLRPLAEFPTPAELRSRYEQHLGFSLDEPAARPLLTRYRGGESARRYYQDAAIRATLEKIAQCETRFLPKRALLSLATGAGKTFIAVNILSRIADAGQLRRALFVCDRDELRSQAAAALQIIFGADAATVSAGDPKKNARILIATYQTLDVDNEEDTANFLTTHYPENYFSHIIIDECHRSAWGQWSQVLTRNPDAVQIGLTATPRELEVPENTRESQADAQITADNMRYFGEPVYEYDIAQGIEDGYLAACEIQCSQVSLDDTGITIEDILARNPVDADTGQPISEAELRKLYEHTSYENRILLPDRVLAMCRDLFNYLLSTGGPEQKTIIFCVRDRHADDVATVMNNLYAQWCQENGFKRVEPYAFKCTAKGSGSTYLADLKGSSRSHFIATTVDLLTTGVDVPVVRNIAFFKYVNSPISFYQMVGRGTRLDAATQKLMFRVYDYTNATRLFGQSFLSRLTARRTSTGGEGTPQPTGERQQQRTILVEGFDVKITPAGRYILTMVDGQTLPVTIEEYKERLAQKLVETVPNLTDFRTIWVNREERRQAIAQLPDGGRSPLVVREVEDLEDCDLYDVLAELGYGLNRRTRMERVEAFAYKHVDWLNEMPAPTAATVKALTAQFTRAGTEGLENSKIFQTPEVRKAGGLDALKVLGKPADVLRETKVRLFAA